MPYVPENNVKYPDNPLAKSLQTLAQLIKMETGLRVASVDYGGWDTHEHQQGAFANLADGLSTALGAFYNDISNHQKRVTLLVMSEFGRRLKSNKSNGTDHGHGSVYWVLGGGIKGRRIAGHGGSLSDAVAGQGGVEGEGKGDIWGMRGQTPN